MIQDTIKTSGEVIIVLKGSDNKIKNSIIVPNLVVTAGKSWIASRITDANDAVMTHMEVGTNNTAAAAGNTALGAAVGSSRTSLTATSHSTNTTQYTCTFGAGVCTGALTEAGIFNASSGGTMLCRTVFSTINKASGDSLAVTWTITVG